MIELTASNMSHSVLDLNEQMVFASQGKYLLTHGAFSSFVFNSKQADYGRGDISQMLRNKLIVASQSGIKQPIVVGVLPFSQQQKAQFFIPIRWQYVSKEQLQQLLLSTSLLQPSVKSFEYKPMQEAFKNCVRQAQECLTSGSLDSLVLSRMLEITTRNSMSKTSILERLISKDNQGYHFSFPLAGNQVFMGVSPELLLRKVALAIESNPLAGSRKRDKDPAVNKHRQQELFNSEKDRLEHKLVAEAFKQILSPLCSSLMMPDVPGLVGTSSMWHLSSHMDGLLAEDKYTAVELAGMLTPSPSIVGSPMAQAKHVIKQLEPFDREYYGGAVGWMDVEGNGEWLLASRCATLSDRSARLFAGAGIVAASTAEEKLSEVNAKLQTMLQVFGLGDIQSACLDPGKKALL